MENPQKSRTQDHGRSAQLGDSFKEALGYAIDAHAGQLRKGTTIPYAAHLLAVAAIALEHGADEETATAALLHDAVEDAGGWERLQDIRERFGPKVADIVEGCSDAFEKPKPPWRLRKETFLNQLQDAAPEVHLVVAADKLHNLSSMIRDYREHGEKVWARFTATREETLWFSRSAMQILLDRRRTPLTLALEQAVLQLEALCIQKGVARWKNTDIR